MAELDADIAVIGGGLGGVAAALAAAESGARVVLTEESDWLGGQLTSQGVPPDEHAWIEQFGCTRSYRRLRNEIRDHYRRWYPLTAEAAADPYLNPGDGRVSRLCHEPRVAALVIESLVGPLIAAGRLTVLREHRPVAAAADGDRVTAVTVRDLAGVETTVTAPYFLDATELGDLLALAGVEHVTGFESRDVTGEPSAPDVAQPDNQQAMSWIFALEHRDGEDHTIDRPADYARIASFVPNGWPGPQVGLTAPDPRTLETVTRQFLPNAETGPVVADQSKDPGDKELWAFRRVLSRRVFRPGFLASDVTLVNWPMIDYLDGSLIGADEQERQRHLAGARELSRSMLYWLQTEAPRPDGGTGWPGLRLRGDVLGTEDGFAKLPYIRESRRLAARTTIVEQDLSYAVRGDAGARSYPDSVGVGMYRIDLHPSTGGDNYIDVASCPFQIPLGALLPVRVTNVLAAAKNLGTTHITNGCYRLHPVEWNVGEVAGRLAAHCLATGRSPGEVGEKPELFAEFSTLLDQAGVETAWPEIKGY
ncbi:FAD-dependent oxidoreductase [Microlunatus sp. GCM10028923]|uniref:FAD-dependent oxidoreductase n=1 Tax=Microlunatus sp. GCM10028923 TaxID=3273400 RepID=UPI003617CDC7